MLYCFFFKQKTAYEMRISDWSSDVCASDLRDAGNRPRDQARQRPPRKRRKHEAIEPARSRGNDRRKHRAAAIGKRPRIALDTVSLTRRRGRQRDAKRPAVRHHPQQGCLAIIRPRERSEEQRGGEGGGGRGRARGGGS